MTEATINLDREALARGKAKLEADLKEFAELVIEDEDTALAMGDLLIERLREFDKAKAFREKYTKPAHATWKGLCELLDTGPYELVCKTIKAKIETWELKKDAERQKAQLAGREALVRGDLAALTTNLQIVNAPEVRAEGVSAHFIWKVKRIVGDLLPDPYWAPDMTAIQDEAERQGVKGDDPPVIPGVVFEKTAQIIGRRN